MLRNATQLLWRGAKAAGLNSIGRAVAAHWPYPVRASLDNGRQMYVDLRSAIGRGIFAKGSFDFEAFRPALDRLNVGNVYIDVGANIGVYAMYALDRIGPAGQVHCFEIDARPLLAFRKTVTTFGLTNVHIHELALANVDGTVGFVRNADHGNNRIEFTKLPSKALQCRKLDSWMKDRPLDRVDLIKIDVEGAEYFVLEGAQQTIATFRPVILCEAADRHTQDFDYKAEDLVSMLSSMDYDVVWIPDAWTPTILGTPRSA